MEAAVRALEAGWATRDFDLLRKHAAPDIVLDWSESVSPNRGVYRGLDEARSCSARCSRPFRSRPGRHEHDLYRPPAGNRGPVWDPRGSSGVETAAVGGQLWSFEEGRVTSAKVFQSGAEAVRAMRIARLEEARLYFVCEGHPGGRSPARCSTLRFAAAPTDAATGEGASARTRRSWPRRPISARGRRVRSALRPQRPPRPRRGLPSGRGPCGPG